MRAAVPMGRRYAERRKLRRFEVKSYILWPMASAFGSMSFPILAVLLGPPRGSWEGWAASTVALVILSALGGILFEAFRK